MRLKGLLLWKALFLTLALTLVVMGCAPQTPASKPPPVTSAAAPTLPPAPPPSSPATPTAYERGKADFEKVVEAAKKEGKVTYYQSVPKDVTDALEKAWKGKYPEIALETLASTTAAAVARIEAEQRSKAYMADVYWGSTSSTWQLKDSGYLLKFDPQRVLPSLNDPTIKWMVNPVIDPEGYYVYGHSRAIFGIAINTNMVPPDKEPKSWADLTDPYWKGKILLRDPTSAGAGVTWLILANRVLGEDYVKKIAEQKPTMSPADSTETIKIIARGEYPLHIPAKAEDVGNLPAGTPIKFIYPKEGVLAAENSFSLVKNGPHPNAALVLGEFLLSKEGQEAIGSTGRVFARGGIPFRDAKFQDLTGVTVLATTQDEVLNKLPKLSEQAKKWYGLD